MEISEISESSEMFAINISKFPSFFGSEFSICHIGAHGKLGKLGTVSKVSEDSEFSTCPKIVAI